MSSSLVVLGSLGRASYESATDTETLEAFMMLSRVEGASCCVWGGGSLCLVEKGERRGFYTQGRETRFFSHETLVSGESSVSLSTSYAARRTLTQHNSHSDTNQPLTSDANHS
jgi:hypothetical protein